MKKILIIEDEAVIREAYTLLLEAHSYEVVAVANGKEALVECEQATFDLILLDLMMPELDGLGFLERIKERAPALVSKIIVMSNLSSGEELIRAKELGVGRHEIKSDLAPNDIIDLVREETN